MLAVSSRRSQLRFFKQIASDLILGTHCGCVLGGALSQRRSDFNPAQRPVPTLSVMAHLQPRETPTARYERCSSRTANKHRRLRPETGTSRGVCSQKTQHNLQMTLSFVKIRRPKFSRRRAGLDAQDAASSQVFVDALWPEGDDQCADN